MSGAGSGGAGGERTDVASRIAPSDPPSALYIHLPWCLRRCGYCDFNAYAVRGTAPIDAYLRGLDAELERAARTLPASSTPTASSAVSAAPLAPQETIFIGGGTPSLFPPAAIRALLTSIERHLGVASGAEITLEANPGAREHGRWEAYRDAGINRLSLGVQSFSDQILARLGRIHTAASAEQAVEDALAAGFRSVNIDLMYGLPGQSLTAATADIEQAIALGLPHISHYQLTLEPETAFGRQPPDDLPDEEEIVAMESVCQALLAAAGRARYEISAYALADHRCAHNLNYWTYGDYLGIGAGAHSKRRLADGRTIRTVGLTSPYRWMAAAGTAAADAEPVEIRTDQLGVEFLVNALRLVDGFSLRLAEARTGIPAERFLAWLQPVLEAGWWQLEAGELRPSEEGLRWVDSALLEIVSAGEG